MATIPDNVELSQNAVLAVQLRDFAYLLRQQVADEFRISAYDRAAKMIEELDKPVATIYATKGRGGLVALPSIGHSIASALVELLTTGRWSQLERLRGAIDPEKLFQIIPGIGPGLAGKLHDELHIDTLEALETAAHDGRIAGVRGIGVRRAHMIKAALAERFGRPRLRRGKFKGPAPAVGLILDVDLEYRGKARTGQLTNIAPKRFNPDGEAWLPILHTQRDDWRFTAHYSNSRLAHELGRLKDWVIIYFESELSPEGQCTVVTETTGPLKGFRVARGREKECSEHYARSASTPAGRFRTEAPGVYPTPSVS